MRATGYTREPQVRWDRWPWGLFGGTGIGYPDTRSSVGGTAATSSVYRLDTPVKVIPSWLEVSNTSMAWSNMKHETPLALPTEAPTANSTGLPPSVARRSSQPWKAKMVTIWA